MPMTKTERVAFQQMVNRAQTLEYLACRVGGDRHRWVQCIPDFEPAYRNTFPIAHQCEVCLTIKRQVITRHGERLDKPMYEYPDGYKYQRDEDDDSPFALTFSAQVVRAAMLARTQVASLPALRGVPHKEVT